jgi:hypothetical protein
MTTQLEFFDMSVSVQPPSGYLEPLPVTLGPNWQPNDIRLVFVTGAGSDSKQQTLPMAMSPDPPATFSTAYAVNQTHETHGVYYRRLQTGDNDSSVAWVKPTSWLWFMFGLLTVRGVDPGTNPTAGTLTGSGRSPVSYVTASTDTVDTTATVPSLAVPSAGTMVLFFGNIAAPEQTPWPKWPVAMGCPTGWTNLVATPASGSTYFPYDTNPSIVVVANSYTAAGSTGSVVFPAGLGSPAFTGLYTFLTPAPDVSVNLGAV